MFSHSFFSVLTFSFSQEKVVAVTVVLPQPVARVTLLQEPTLVNLGPSPASHLVPLKNASVLPLTFGQIKWVNLQLMPKH